MGEDGRNETTPRYVFCPEFHLSCKPIALICMLARKDGHVCTTDGIKKWEHKTPNNMWLRGYYSSVRCDWLPSQKREHRHLDDNLSGATDSLQTAHKKKKKKSFGRERRERRMRVIYVVKIPLHPRLVPRSQNYDEGYHCLAGTILINSSKYQNRQQAATAHPAGLP